MSVSTERYTFVIIICTAMATGARMEWGLGFSGTIGLLCLDHLWSIKQCPGYRHQLPGWHSYQSGVQCCGTEGTARIERFRIDEQNWVAPMPLKWKKSCCLPRRTGVEIDAILKHVSQPVLESCGRI